jgi:hypothetical protein
MLNDAICYTHLYTFAMPTRLSASDRMRWGIQCMSMCCREQCPSEIVSIALQLHTPSFVPLKRDVISLEIGVKATSSRLTDVVRAQKLERPFHSSSVDLPATAARSPAWREVFPQ